MELLTEYLENGYPEKLFYYCLRKTGDVREAEDLASDISLSVIQELSRGVVPQSFSAWVWKIAGNRYARWADKRRKLRENTAELDVSEYDLSDCDSAVDSDMILREQISLMRRELAFISSDYREIVVRYYIENKRVADIAESLDIPEGTVMSKLFRARKILREGMNMAREFGKMSYAPENLFFTMNGMRSENGAPWCYLKKLLDKNIMLAAYRTPSTAEELSVEVGVALPYIEEELKALTENTLMKKNGKKYETNFFIISADAQKKADEHLKTVIKPLTQSLYKMSVISQSRYVSMGYQPREDELWFYLMREVDGERYKVVNSVNSDKADMSTIGSWGHTIRPCGGEWDIIGREICDAGSSRISCLGCVTDADARLKPEIKWLKYYFPNHQHRYDDISYDDAAALCDIVRGKPVEKWMEDRLSAYRLIRRGEGGLEPTFLLIKESKKLTEEKQAEYDELEKCAEELMMKHYLYCRELVKNETPEPLKNNVNQIAQACGDLFCLREAVLDEALRGGLLALPEDEGRRDVLGARLEM